MERVGVRKIKGGKLLTVKVTEENGIIKKAMISGDFFVHPEESIDEIEDCLRGVHLCRVREALRELTNKKRISTVGFVLDDIADIIEGLG